MANSNDLLSHFLEEEDTLETTEIMSGDIDVSYFTDAEKREMFSFMDEKIKQRIAILEKMAKASPDTGIAELSDFAINLSKVNMSLLKSDILNGAISESTMESIRKGYGGMCILSEQTRKDYKVDKKNMQLMKKIASMSKDELMQMIDVLYNTEAVLAEEQKLYQNPKEIYKAYADPTEIGARLMKQEEIEDIVQVILDTPTSGENMPTTPKVVQAPTVSTTPVKTAPVVSIPNTDASNDSLNNDSIEVIYVKELLRLIGEFKSVQGDSSEEIPDFRGLDRSLSRTQKTYENSSGSEINIDDLQEDFNDLARSIVTYQVALQEEETISDEQLQRCTICNQIVRLSYYLKKQIIDPATHYVDILAMNLIQAILVAKFENEDNEEAIQVLLDVSSLMDKVDTLRTNVSYLCFITSDEFHNTYRGKGLEKLCALEANSLLQEVSEIKNDLLQVALG